jgi:micrococcal nuclease
MKETGFTLIFSILLLAFLIFLFVLPYTIKEPEEIADKLVTNVIDGDTFQYYNAKNYSYEIVRLLCVDAPEKGEEGYIESKQFLESLILGKQINLNPSITDKDIYGRSLRYVYVDNKFINKEILSNGYGELLIIPPEECKEVIF